MTTHPERFWLGLLVAFALVLWLVRDVLLPFLLGMAIGYLLNPLIDRLERRGISRAAAAGVMVGSDRCTDGADRGALSLTSSRRP